MNILVDSDALIKLTRAGIKELLVDTFKVHIPESVVRETVDEGKRLGCADAIIIEGNIAGKRIEVMRPEGEGPPSLSLFSGGDREVVHCAVSKNFSTVVTDDAMLLEKLKALGISATVPAAMICAIGRKRRLSAKRVIGLLEALRPYISSDEYTTYLLIIEGRYPGK